MKTSRIRLLLLFLFELLEAEFLFADNSHVPAEPDRSPAIIEEPQFYFTHPKTFTEAVEKRLISADDRITQAQLESPRIWNVGEGKLIPGALQVGPFLRTDKVGHRFQEVIDSSKLTEEESRPGFSKETELVIYGNCKDVETCQSVLLALQILHDRGYKKIKVLEFK